ncbi:hypothetical protein ABZY42_33425 [Streptomyces sp. NPDC006622]|uniref:hypothetical protein n=1 Tax=Streptomyces sp. NPDC006622 TaxID=3155459 RepID=UPI0033A5C8CC
MSEMFRLVRGTGHILDVLDVLHRDQVALRIHDGAFSAMDLTARHPRTGDLLSTVEFMVQTLAAAGDLQRELTYDGLRAAEAKGSKGGRRPAVAAAKTADVRTAYLEGRSIAALARDHGVSRGAIRTAVADLLPDHAAIEYAAGDNHAPACYSLSLYHQSSGEQHAADFYRRQAHRVTTATDSDTLTVVGTCPPPQTISFDASLPTVLHTLNRLYAGPGTRPRRRHRIDALTNYVADTVTRHYTRHPGIEIPVPEPRFAERVAWLLTATLPWTRRTRPSRPSGPGLPARQTHHSSYSQSLTNTRSCPSTT